MLCWSEFANGVWQPTKTLGDQPPDARSAGAVSKDVDKWTAIEASRNLMRTQPGLTLGHRRGLGETDPK